MRKPVVNIDSVVYLQAQMSAVPSKTAFEFLNTIFKQWKQNIMNIRRADFYNSTSLENIKIH